MEVVNSKNNVPIRLTEERWFHIVENHDDLAGYYDEVLNTLEDPDCILRGYRGTRNIDCGQEIFENKESGCCLPGGF